jgi:hypothetical protein
LINGLPTHNRYQLVTLHTTLTNHLELRNIYSKNGPTLPSSSAGPFFRTKKNKTIQGLALGTSLAKISFGFGFYYIFPLCSPTLRRKPV